jgi:GNAT superfamily N-acetyltransferase
MAQPTDEITYRLATTDDVDALAQKRWQMETERHPDIQADYAAYLAAARQDIRPEIERGAHIAFLAEAEGEVVACAILIWWTMLPSLTEAHRKRAYVSSVYCDPAWRRRGIARHLMEQLLAQAQEMGVQRLILWASDMGRPLYLDLGFEPSRALELNF